MPLIFVLSFTPAQSLKLAQTTATMQVSSKTSAFKKAKDDLQKKIDSLKELAKSNTALNGYVNKLQAFANYLSYLEKNLSSVSDLKIDKVIQGAEKIYNAAQNVINTSGVLSNLQTAMGNIDNVTQNELGLSYNPGSSSVASGQIGTFTEAGGGSGTGGVTGGGNIGGGNTGGGNTGGGGTPATPSP